MLIGVSALVAGCQTAGNSCDGWRPINPKSADVAQASDELVAQILAHNEHGRDTCGWRPGR